MSGDRVLIGAVTLGILGVIVALVIEENSDPDYVGVCTSAEGYRLDDAACGDFQDDGQPVTGGLGGGKTAGGS